MRVLGADSWRRCIGLDASSNLPQPGQLRECGAARCFQRGVLFRCAGRGPEGFALLRHLAQFDKIETARPAPEDAQQMRAICALPPLHLPPDFHPRVTKVSITFFSPEWSKFTVSLLPSTPTTRP